ncbi:MAG: WecB/TagA/CpsF family glycosyltransferase [Pleurocapsa sp.]
MNETVPAKIKMLNIEIDNISSLELLQNIRTGGILFTPNVDHLMKLQKDADFYHTYQQADYLVCDSKIIYWASIFLGNKIIEKISGSDFFPKFYQYYKDDEHIKIFLLGGIDKSAEQAKQNINDKTGRPIVVGAYSPSMGFEKNELECQKIVDLINNSGATVLAIGVGAPKQEKWIVRYKKLLPKIKIFLAIGATIDFEAEISQRSPQWMSQVGLEWLFRLVSEPKRLWKRYLVESPPFFWLILKQKIQQMYFHPYENSSDRLDNQEKSTKNNSNDKLTSLSSTSSSKANHSTSTSVINR